MEEEEDAHRPEESGGDLNTAAFLFGNVDESGRLEQEGWGVEMQAILTAGGSVLQKLSAAPIFSDAPDNSKTDKIRPKIHEKSDAAVVVATSNAVDYADIEEAVDDDASARAASSAHSTPHASPTIAQQTISFNSLSDAEKYNIVKRIFPSFDKNKILKFSELFQPAILLEKRAAENNIRPLHANKLLKYTLADIPEIVSKKSSAEVDQRELFDKEWMSYTLKDKARRKLEMDENKGDKHEKSDGARFEFKTVDDIPPDFHPVNIVDWESKIIWDTPEDMDVDENLNAQPPVVVDMTQFNVRNYDMDDDDWLDSIIWDEKDVDRVLRRNTIQITMNDPGTIIDLPSTEPTVAPQTTTRAAAKGTETSKAPVDPFNLSNDRFYENPRAKGSGRTRQMFHKIPLQHAPPAIKLRQPFYRINMTRHDLRSWHRPQLKVTPNEVSKFFRVKNLKKKKAKVKDVATWIKSVKDVTLKDNSDYALFEYSEEYPVFLSNGGMASYVLNYYRKKEEKDGHVPKAEIGAPVILEQVDASPFLGFGDVEPGQTVTAIKNNLYVAPLFPHAPSEDDFLVIRHTFNNETKYYIRPIPRLFCVGQINTLITVPPPQSRKVKMYIRDRLKIAASRSYAQYGRRSLFKIDYLINNYHEYHEQSIRKHLKDFGDLVRRGGRDSWHLSLRPDIPIPSEEELQRWVTPEMVCWFESMRVGQQRLADTGYGTGEIDEGEDADGEKESHLDDEVQMAPWVLTKNFMLATQGKAMVKLYGTGDPTGRGEGFSFFRANMKEMYFGEGTCPEEAVQIKEYRAKHGTKFTIVDQQKIYKKEIKRIWNVQVKALANTTEPTLSEEDQGNFFPGDASTIDGFDFARDMQRQHPHLYDETQSRATSPTHSKIRSTLDDETMSASSSRINSKNQKCLVIRRLFKNADGSEDWREEMVRDPKIANAYLQQKRLIDMSAGAGVNAIRPDDDEETKKRKIREELRRIRRDFGGRSGLDPNYAPKQAHRKCRGCGQVGHIASNRVCPLYAQNYPERVGNEPPKAAKAKQPKKPKPKEEEQPVLEISPDLVKAEGSKLKISSVAFEQLKQKEKEAAMVKLPNITLKVKAPSSNSQPPPTQ